MYDCDDYPAVRRRTRFPILARGEFDTESKISFIDATHCSSCSLIIDPAL
jgi:hypothetical protein